MAIEYSTTTISYVGNGSTTNFDFDFPVRESKHIEVKLLSPELVSTTLIEGSDYSVQPKDGTFPTSDGGTITYPMVSSGLEPLADDWVITITRVVPYTQPDVYPENSALNPKAIENSLDNLEMQIQQIRTLAGLSTDSADEANRAATAAKNSASEAQASAEKASEEATKAENSANNSEMQADRAQSEANNAQQSAIQSGNYALQAQQSAMAVAPEAYDPEKTYNFPDVVAYTDGETYRCIGNSVIGESPDTSNSWVRIAGIENDFWDIDINGDVMPAINPAYAYDFVLDNNGDIMPR